MDVARINDILVDSLGEIDENQQPVEGSEMFDFFVITLALNTDKVQEHAAEMVELFKEWPTEGWNESVPPLGEEISYLTAGAVLGDQEFAFMLFAFGKLLGWWDILDPHTVLGMEYNHPQGRQLAGMGMVAIIGYNPKVTV